MSYFFFLSNKVKSDNKYIQNKIMLLKTKIKKTNKQTNINVKILCANDAFNAILGNANFPSNGKSKMTGKQREHSQMKRRTID